MLWTAALAGVGATTMFAVAIVGATRALEMSRDGRPVEAVVLGLVGGLALAVVAAAIVFGIVVMTEKSLRRRATAPARAPPRPSRLRATRARSPFQAGRAPLSSRRAGAPPRAEDPRPPRPRASSARGAPRLLRARPAPTPGEPRA